MKDLKTLLIVFHFQCAVLSANYDFISHISKQIVHHLKPYQISFFNINSTRKSKSLYRSSLLFFKEATPRLLIDTNESSTMKENRSLNLPVFQDPRHSTLNIIFDSDDYSSSRFLLNYFTRLTRLVHAHCLIITFYQKSIPKDSIARILRYGWSKKFLDLSVLAVNSNEDANTIPVLFNFDPFRNVVNTELFDSITVKLFPHKLKDVNGYKIKLPMFNHPPFTVLVDNGKGSLEQSGRGYTYIEFALDTMNFTKDFVFQLTGETDAVILNKFFTSVRTGTVNMWIDVVPITWIKFKTIIAFGPECEEQVAEVPVLPVPVTVSIPKDTIHYVLIIPITILILTYILSVFKVMSQHWHAFEIIKMLMGISVKIESSKNSNRIIYLFIILISIIYSNKLYSIILNVSIHQHDMKFESYEDLGNSRLPIFIHNTNYRRVFDEFSDERLKNLEPKVERFYFNHSCMLQYVLDRRKKRICIESGFMAQIDLIKYGKEADGTPVIKFAKPPLVCDRMTFFFETSWPCAERFVEIQRIIQENGIWTKLRDKFLRSYKKIFEMPQEDESDEKKLMDNFSVKILAVILSAGLFSAFVVFLVELLANKCGRIVKKHVLIRLRKKK